MSDEPQRRLAAIVSADVVGYSRLMGEDEVNTLASLRQWRAEVFGPTIADHRGNIVKSMGDGWLVEFDSAVDAVTCAIQVQDKTSGHETLKLRIGLHIGDISHADDDIYGDGVNIAARLQEIAGPGAIVISDMARRSIDRKLAAEFSDLGRQQLKNIAEPVSAYGWRMTAEQVRLGRQSVSDKPSLAVLPFKNMSGDPEQEYFADGVTEEIITALSKIRTLFVIGRNSSFAFKGQETDVRMLSEDLGVRYILEGSIRKARNNVRIAGQLIDSATGEHLWADRFEGTLDDIFGLQDEVTTQVTAAVAPTVRAAEIATARRKGTDNVSGYDLYLQAVARLYESDTDSAIPLLSRAREVSPSFSPAYGLEAWSRTLWVYSPHLPEFSQNRDIAVDLTRKALKLGDNDPELLGQIGYALAFFEENIELGFKLVAEALEAAPSLSWLWASQGFLHMFYRDSGDAVAAFEMAKRLDPRNPLSFRNNLGLAGAKIQLSDFAGGLDVALEAYEHAPENITVLRLIAACYSGLDDMEEANNFANEVTRLAPSFRISTHAKTHPMRHAKNFSILRDAMIRAGIPD